MWGAVKAAAPIDLTMNTESRVVGTKTETERRWVEGHYETREITILGHTYTRDEWVIGHYENVQVEREIVKDFQVATTHTYTNAEGKTGLSYTVTASDKYNTQKDNQGVNYDRYRAQTYFTTTTEVREGLVLAVQFLGAEIEDGNKGSYDYWTGTYSNGYDPDFKVQDYGIYLYDPETGEKGEWLSAKTNGNYFGKDAGITTGSTFGVYYVDKDGNYITTTDNVVGNFDDDSHDLTVYDEEHPEGYTETTEKHFLCLFNNTYDSGKLNQTHWEFMLQTTLDDPYFAVNPNDFGTEVQIEDPIVNNPNGQPLPGTLATLLIGSLCAATLRKKNKKS